METTKMIKHTLHLTIEDSVFKNLKSESIAKWMCGSNTGICDQLIKHLVTAIDSDDEELEITPVKKKQSGDNRK